MLRSLTPRGRRGWQHPVVLFTNTNVVGELFREQILICNLQPASLLKFGFKKKSGGKCIQSWHFLRLFRKSLHCNNKKQQLRKIKYDFPVGLESIPTNCPRRGPLSSSQVPGVTLGTKTWSFFFISQFEICSISFCPNWEETKWGNVQPAETEQFWEMPKSKFGPSTFSRSHLGDIFECFFKAQSSRLESLFSLKHVKRDVRALSFEFSKMSPHVVQKLEAQSSNVSFAAFQSSNLSFATFQWKETFELWALSFETAFENVTPSGIGCTWIDLIFNGVQVQTSRS